MITTFNKLRNYCEKESFKGWDPYDGLNSKAFEVLPIKNWSLARLAWIQGFKRSPINFRKILLISKGHNAKGIGLFISAYCNLYHLAESGNTEHGSKEDILETINFLSEKLISMQAKGYAGSCWGYNFDWQARGGLFFPKNTPTVVATTFAVYGLLDAYEITNNKKYIETSVSSAQFVLKDLNRKQNTDGSFLFSYSPLHGNNTVYNASLLGSKLLARIYALTGDMSLLEPAKKSVYACLNAQEKDGSWIYGELTIQNWKDSYHTGFNLESLHDYQKYTGDKSVASAIRKGTEYYLNNFFLKDGTPKYYHNKVNPIDIHSPAQLMVTLYRLGILDENIELAEKVMNWTIKNMQHQKRGFFFYQLKKGISSKIPYMRWSQAWMMYSMSFLLRNNLGKQ